MEKGNCQITHEFQVSLALLHVSGEDRATSLKGATWKDLAHYLLGSQSSPVNPSDGSHKSTFQAFQAHPNPNSSTSARLVPATAPCVFLRRHAYDWCDMRRLPWSREMGCEDSVLWTRVRDLWKPGRNARASKSPRLSQHHLEFSVHCPI